MSEKIEITDKLENEVFTPATIINIATALSKAQSEIKSVKKETINPFFKSKYADLAAICDYVYPILSKYGLAISQPSFIKDDKIYIKTLLIHTSGSYIESVWPITGTKQQELGSATSYARRYSLMAICGLSASGEDDDGNESDKKVETKQEPNKNYLIRNAKEIAAAKKIEPQFIQNYITKTFKKTAVGDLEIDQLQNLIIWLSA